MQKFHTYGLLFEIFCWTFGCELVWRNATRRPGDAFAIKPYVISCSSYFIIYYFNCAVEGNRVPRLWGPPGNLRACKIYQERFQNRRRTDKCDHQHQITLFVVIYIVTFLYSSVSQRTRSWILRCGRGSGAGRKGPVNFGAAYDFGRASTRTDCRYNFTRYYLHGTSQSRWIYICASLNLRKYSKNNLWLIHNTDTP